MTEIESPSFTSLSTHDRQIFAFRIFKTLQMWSDHPIIVDAVCRELEEYKFFSNRERLDFVQSLRPFVDIPRVKETIEHLKKNGIYTNKDGMHLSFEEYSDCEMNRIHKEMNHMIVLFVIVILLALFIVVYARNQ
ncbi:hypothetical protein QR680_014562 [Steinernema hermaphroditum]|uniref:Uncharacterized protein n=1 Tax=Steinernema hermaphroditum TaxID=289476 RepID=A0AA39M4E9_9BILA|nr:hypothetical protein QR680_014562 [Steinernema hermaphroditum]